MGIERQLGVSLCGICSKSFLGVGPGQTPFSACHCFGNTRYDADTRQICKDESLVFGGCNNWRHTIWNKQIRENNWSSTFVCVYSELLLQVINTDYFCVAFFSEVSHQTVPTWHFMVYFAVTVASTEKSYLAIALHEQPVTSEHNRKSLELRTRSFTKYEFAENSRASNQLWMVKWN